MGVSISPNIAQEIKENTLHDLSEIEVNINNIGAFSNTWEDHLIALDRLLEHLQSKGFIINPLKCKWDFQETDFLGHWLMPMGIKPWQNRIDVIHNIMGTKRLMACWRFQHAMNE